MLALAISSCTEDTTTLGNSLTSEVDKFTIIPDTFDVQTRSIKIDSVLSRSEYSYLGRVKDPETSSYITSDYMTQFHILENEASAIFPPKSSIVNHDQNNEPVADSCFINVIVNAFQGDSLTAMKLTLCELDKPVSDKGLYYTDFDPEAKGYLRPYKNESGELTGAVRVNRVYSLTDMTQNDSVRNLLRDGSRYMYVSIPLNQPYKDKAGKEYNNYGTYLLRTYYEHPEYFKNATTFTRNVCPGFYFKSSDGLGLMLEVTMTQLEPYFTYNNNSKKVVDSRRFYSTEEVLQTTHISNDKSSIEKLVNQTNCTYLKTPAGICTEVTLPIEQIKRGHENDTITSGKITFNRMKDYSVLSEGMLEEPTNLLMIERDSLYSFFEHNSLPDNIRSYIATYNSEQKTYSFNNINNLINRMYSHQGTSENWNKAVLIPVQVTETINTTNSVSATTITNVSNEMNINSVRLVGGENNEHQPVRISIIYNKNK